MEAPAADEGLAGVEGEAQPRAVATEIAEDGETTASTGCEVSGATEPAAAPPPGEAAPRSPEEAGRDDGAGDEYEDEDDFEREIPNVSPTSNDMTGSPDTSAFQQSPQQQGQLWQGQAGGDGRMHERDAAFSESEGDGRRRGRDGYSESEEEGTALSAGQLRENRRREEEERMAGTGKFDERYQHLVGTLFRAEIESARALLEAAHQGWDPASPSYTSR
ncbi:hypothetical protein T484DRAFT_1885387, partial [Baffinella frigidus]